METTESVQKKSIEVPDQVREFDSGRMDSVTLDSFALGRMVLQPGWKWSASMKSAAQTDSCEIRHRLYVAEGSLHIRTNDGTDLDVTAGDVVAIEPGHDAWVTGAMSCVLYDFSVAGA